LKLSHYIFLFDFSSLLYWRPRQSSQLGVYFQTIFVAESKTASNRFSSYLNSLFLASVEH
jgi:hypothetical protein